MFCHLRQPSAILILESCSKANLLGKYGLILFLKYYIHLKSNLYLLYQEKRNVNTRARTLPEVIMFATAATNGLLSEGHIVKPLVARSERKTLPFLNKMLTSFVSIQLVT